ncbi:MAG: GspH/FimT family pseudopilin [Gammaproteobacteria bacterium]|nr:GspH/FimT family pseudopilin [Gammaproteobacteria bacterium]
MRLAHEIHNLRSSEGGRCDILKRTSDPRQSNGFASQEGFLVPISRLQSSKKRHKAGFTLIELMVTVALLGILATIAVPSFRSQIESGRQRSASNELQQLVKAAGSQASSTSRPSVLCATRDASQCDGTWRDGWMLFVDRDRNGDMSSGDILIGRGGHPSRQYKASTNAIVFNSNGINTAADLRICSDDEPALDVELSINAFGQITVSRGVTGGCGP